MPDSFSAGNARRFVDPTAGDDTSERSTLDALLQLGSVPPPRTEFARSLKEELMHSPVTPFSIGPVTGHSPQPLVRSVRPVVRTLRHPAFGWLASAALVTLMVFGAYVAVLKPGDQGAKPPTMSAMAPFGSPEATPADATTCASPDPYMGCVITFSLPVGSTSLWFENFDESALQARAVQLQGWAVAPGASIGGVSGEGLASGVVVDVVLSGAYVATFDVPVVVARGGYMNDLDQVRYLDAGATVELGRFDSVAYQLGGLVELHNPLDQERIEFKRAVIYDGDISAFSAITDGVTTNVEGDAELLDTIGSYKGNANVQLLYVQVNPASAFPPPTWKNVTTIGPVDPQRGPRGTDGFVLVIGQNMG